MDTSQPDSGVAQPAKRSWRRHSDEFKSQVIAMARQGHGSVAAVALANGLNANMLRRWLRESEMAEAARSAPSTQAVMTSPAFVPVTLTGSDDRAVVAPEPTVDTSPPRHDQRQLQPADGPAQRHLAARRAGLIRT